MKFNQNKLATTFLSRIKTWDRPFNSLNFYYAPKLYLKLAEKNPEIHLKLINLNKSLVNTIVLINDNQKIIEFENIEFIQTIGKNVYVKEINEDRIILENFKIKKSALSQISIDHKESLFSIIENNLNDFDTLQYISDLILNDNTTLNLSQMKNEYNRIISDYDKLNIDLNKMYDEIEKLYSFKNLNLMPRSENSSKGKK